MEVEASLRTVLETYTRLAAKRQTRQGLSVGQLLYFHKTGVTLCRMTGRPTVEAAAVHAAQLLGEVVAEDAPQGPPPSRKPVAELTFVTPPPSARPQAPVRSAPPCSVCGKPLSATNAWAGALHRSCRPGKCLGCGRIFPKARLVKLRCAECASRQAGQRGKADAVTRSRRKSRAARAIRPARERTPMELANLRRQEEQRREARLLSQIAPGPKSAQPPRAVIVRGGLPGLGASRR